MPIIALSIVFVLILAYFLRKSDHEQDDLNKKFWEREQKANHARKKDINNLPYINIPLEKIPQNLHTETERKLVAVVQKRMINLTDQTNTQLKEEYGVGNLEILTEYESNYIELLHLLPEYCNELIADGQKKAAKEILNLCQKQDITSAALSKLMDEV